MGRVRRPSGEKSFTTWPRLTNSPETAASVRTTPLTCGNQASVTMAIRTRKLQEAVTHFWPFDDLEAAVKMLDEGGAAFDPIAVIEIVDVVDHAVVRGMDMAADDALGAALAGFAHHGVLEMRDELDRLLDLEFEIGRERPVGQADQAA